MASCRSCTRLSSSSDALAPISAQNMSHCVSQTSPWVARKASAACPPATAAAHSSISKTALKARQAHTVSGASQRLPRSGEVRTSSSRTSTAGTKPCIRWPNRS
ncbi:hypothetical protein GCM10010234_79510 [Streptomyces hawaiiensis]